MKTTNRTTSKSRLQRFLLPSFTGRGLGVGLLFACLALFVACSSDDDNEGGNKNATYTVTTVSEAPVWQIDWSFNQERPSWTEPDASLYENWTILKVQIEEELQPYVSEGDMMAVFINGELRGMTTPATLEDETLTNKFLLKVYGNETGTETVHHMSLQYYCQKLNQIFTLSDNIKLDSDQTTGIDEDFIPDFIFGSAKYPVVMLFDAKYLLDKANIEPAKGDLLAAFVGSECRGVNASPATKQTLVVYGREEGEPVTLKYYQAATGKLFVFADAAQTKK